MRARLGFPTPEAIKSATNKDKLEDALRELSNGGFERNRHFRPEPGYRGKPIRISGSRKVQENRLMWFLFKSASDINDSDAGKKAENPTAID
jgi:hypothetical protein